MNNSLIDKLDCQERTQDDTTCILQVKHQSRCDHANDSLINAIPILIGNLNYILTRS